MLIHNYYLLKYIINIGSFYNNIFSQGYIKHKINKGSLNI